MKRLTLALLVAAALSFSYVQTVEAFCLWDYCTDCSWFICWGE